MPARPGSDRARPPELGPGGDKPGRRRPDSRRAALAGGAAAPGRRRPSSRTGRRPDAAAGARMITLIALIVVACYLGVAGLIGLLMLIGRRPAERRVQHAVE